MWKRNEPDQPGPDSAAPPAVAPDRAAPRHGEARRIEATPRDVPNIGKSVVIKGELTGSEDLIIDGQVEGTIDLREHLLTIGPGGKINAQIMARSVVVAGRIDGNITASEKIEICESGSVDGDVTVPRFAIAEGARFRGSVDMSGSAQTGQTQTAPSSSRALVDGDRSKDPTRPTATVGAASAAAPAQSTP